MGDHMDPQVQTDLIKAGGGAIAGAIAMLGEIWRRRRKRTTQDQRCEKVCWNMVNAMEAMLAVIEALGGNHPGLNSATIKVRVQIDHAREYLEDPEG